MAQSRRHAAAKKVVQHLTRAPVAAGESCVDCQPDKPVFPAFLLPLTGSLSARLQAPLRIVKT
jgi:hypothetical protein